MSPPRSLEGCRPPLLLATALAAGAILLLAALPVHGLVLDSGRCDATTLPAICANATKARYCWPCSTSKFAACDGAGGGAVKTCAAGKRFDYGLRRCVATAYAKTCTNWRCPPGDFVLGEDGFSTMIGTPVGIAPANATIDITQPGSFYVVCPVHGHCQGGMIFRVTATAAPAGYTPKEYHIEWEELLTNADLYPKRYEDVNAYVGDKIHLEWDEIIHAVITFTPSASSVASSPGPPQPVYKCPTWSLDAQGNAIPLPGETVLTAPGPFGNATFVATAPDEFWAVCNIGPHCRMGMIFKITVLAAPVGYSPVRHVIHWTSNNFDNFPDVTVYVGDTIFWHWESAPALRPTDPSFFGLRTQDIQYHQLSFIRDVQKY